MAPLADFAERVARAPEPAAIVLCSPKAAEALAGCDREPPGPTELLALEGRDSSACVRALCAPGWDGTWD